MNKSAIAKKYFLKSSLLLFSVLSCFSEQAIASESSFQGTEPHLFTFDLQKTIQSAPMLSNTLALSWQHTSSQSRAYRFENTIDIKTLFRFKIDHTHFSYDRPQTEKIKNMTRFFTAIHLPLKKLTLAQGIGWANYQYRKRHSGPATLFQMAYQMTPNVNIGIETENTYIQKRFDQKLRIGLMYGMKNLSVRLGYQWINLKQERIESPEAGLILQF